jgi:hypothetical protein
MAVLQVRIQEFKLGGAAQKHKENSINVFLFHGAQFSQFTRNIILSKFSLSHHCFINETWNIDRTGADPGGAHQARAPPS